DARGVAHLARSVVLGGRRARRRAVPRRGTGDRSGQQGTAAAQDLRGDLPGRAAARPAGDELHPRHPPAARPDHRERGGTRRACAPARGDRDCGGAPRSGVTETTLDRVQIIPSRRRGDQLWERFAGLAMRRPWTIAAVGALVLAAAAPFAARLYGDLRTDLRELLPQGSPSAVALRELENRIGGLASLARGGRTDDLKAG